MKITMDLDDKLVQHGLELGGQSSQVAFVSEAVREYVDKRMSNGHPPLDNDAGSETASQAKIKRTLEMLREIAGTIDYDPDYDYKAHR